MRRRSPPGAALAAWALFGFAAPAIGQLPTTLTHRIDERVAGLLEGAPIPGLALGIVIGDSLVYARGYGLADRATGRRVQPGTVFQIGSTSKTFTSTLLGMLADRDLIELDAPITDYLPPDIGYPAAGRVATVAEVATHTAGLPRDPPGLRRAHGDAPVLAFTHFELYRAIRQTRLVSDPGERWSYSNFGFAILGHALERVADRPYEVLLRRELFTPLGMHESTVTLWPRYDTILARPYYPNARTGELDDYTPWDPEAMSPAGGIASSVADLARYVRLHMRGRVGGVELLSAARLRELHAPRAPIDEGLSYGLGWFIRDAEGLGRIVEHGGEVDGYTSFLGFSPEREVGVILLANAGDAPLSDLADWIFAEVASGRP